MIICCIFSMSVLGQNSYRKGYFINQQNEKVEGYIMDEDSFFTPTQFLFKASIDQATPTNLNIDNASEVVINNIATYSRLEVSVDESSSQQERLTRSRISSFVARTLFAKKLTQGTVALYELSTSEYQRFFVSKDGSVTSLEFKYFLNSKMKIGKNLNYQKQLKEKFSCEGTNNPTAIAYDRRSLVQYFKNYSRCKGYDFKTLKEDRSEYVNALYKVKAEVALAMSSFSSTSGTEVEGISATALKVGVELEYVFAFNNNKWSVFVNPVWSSPNEIKMVTEAGTIAGPPSSGGVRIPVYDTSTVSFSMFELPIGARHYLFIDKQNALFLEGGLTYSMPISDSVVKTVNYKDELIHESKLRSTTNFFVGAGYTFNRKFNAALRYDLVRPLKVRDLTVNQNTLSLRLSYSIW